MQIKNILVPTDFSALSELALQYAALLARCSSAKLSVLYAEPFLPPPYFTSGKIEDLHAQHRDSLREAEKALQDFAKHSLGESAGVLSEVVVMDAAPAAAISAFSDRTRPDLIVMGTHGRSGVNRLMLGSVAERVLREAKIPVLTVRGETGKRISPPKSILCPVNDTPAGRVGFQAAVAAAQCFDASLTVLHVRERSAEGAIQDLCDWVPSAVRSHCRLTEQTRNGEAAAEILSAARENACDLLVLGSQHRRFFDATVLGATVARVVRHAPCPVLTAPAAQD